MRQDEVAGGLPRDKEPWKRRDMEVERAGRESLGGGREGVCAGND